MRSQNAKCPLHPPLQSIHLGGRGPRSETFAVPRLPEQADDTHVIIVSYSIVQHSEL